MRKRFSAPALLLALVIAAGCSNANVPVTGSPGATTPGGTALPSGQGASPSNTAASVGSLAPGSTGTPGSDGSPGPSASGDPGTTGSPGASPAPTTSPDPSSVPAGDPRVQAGLASLTTDEDLVGQLLLLGWLGNTPASVGPTLTALHPGGIVYIGSNADRAAGALAINRRIDRVAANLGIPEPFKAIDLEGGSVQRIFDIPNLGSNMAFGKTHPTDAQACQRGATHAAQLNSMDFNMDLAPVLDVLTNPHNTVIGNRSYGSSPALVARLGANYILGLQGGGILGVGKHFPGHGDTTVDSHLGLPVVPYGLKHLQKVELVPFVRAMQPAIGISSIMVGHLALPKLDPTRTPASLSKPIIHGLLRDRLGFHGLVMTDDLGAMAAITSKYSPAQAAVMAIEAGADMLIITGDIAHQTVYRDALLAALHSGQLPRARLMEAVRHVLQAKARFGLLGGGGPPAVAC